MVLFLLPRSLGGPFPILKESDPGAIGSGEQVSLVSLKELAAEMLDRHSMLRMLVLAEPDQLPREHALAKIQVFARIFHEELTRK